MSTELTITLPPVPSTFPYPGEGEREGVSGISLQTVKIDGTGRQDCATGLLTLENSNTAVTADTIDFETLGTYDLDGTMLNPGNVLELIEDPSVFYHAWVAAKRVIEERPKIKEAALGEAAMQQFLVELGIAILDLVPGPHVTFLDPRHHNDWRAIVKDAKQLISRFEQGGVSRENIVVSIPATEDGVRAARELSGAGRIQTNLILASGMIHVAACAEAEATTVTFAVGPILDWYERKRNAEYPNLNTHPGIETIQSSVAYFKLHPEIKTKLIGANFRQLSEITPLGGLDAIALSSRQIEGLYRREHSLAFSQSGSSTPILRARQAQYPTSLLALKRGFMSAMSAPTRSKVAGTLYVALDAMKAQMDRLEGIIKAEVTHQFRLETMQLKALYGHKTTKKIDKNRQKPSSDKTEGKDNGYKRFLTHQEENAGRLASTDGPRSHELLMEDVDYF